MKAKITRDELAARLAAHRELSESELQQINADPQLQAQLYAYREQDTLLGQLEQERVPSAVIGRILSATTLAPAAAKRALFTRRWVWSALAIVLVMAIALSGTGYAAAQSLPGDALYTVKRGYEQARLGLTLNAGQRAAYQLRLEGVRQDEARRVLALGRQGVAVELAGTLEQAADGTWSIAGVPVTPPDGAEWLPGMHVQLQGLVEGKHVRARLHQQTGTVTPVGGARRLGQTASAATIEAAETPTEQSMAESTTVGLAILKSTAEPTPATEPSIETGSAGAAQPMPTAEPSMNAAPVCDEPIAIAEETSGSDSAQADTSTAQRGPANQLAGKGAAQ